MSENENSADLRYRIRVSLVDSAPEIWRLIELDAALALDAVHLVIQRAFGWRTEHLHKFAKRDPDARLRLVEDDEQTPQEWYDQGSLDEGLEGLLETEWTLGQALNETSPTLFYEYDFGDGWLHRLDLVKVVPADKQRAAQLLDGKRRAPLEDSGGIYGYQQKLEVLANPQDDDHEWISGWVDSIAGPWRTFDPDDLDVDHVNAELAILHTGDASPTEAASACGDLASRMLGTRAVEFRRYVSGLELDEPATVDTDVAARMVEPYAWLLRRIGQDGMTLSKAGWMPTAVVSDAMRDLDWGWRWYGEFKRESQTIPIQRLRANAQRFGFIRKSKGRLLLTTAGRKLLDDPVGLWHAIARGLVFRQRDEATADAVVLFAVEIARGDVDESRSHWDRVADGLGMLGWARSNREWLSGDDVASLLVETRNVCTELGVFTIGARKYEVAGVTPEGRAFARAVLQA